MPKSRLGSMTRHALMYSFLLSAAIAHVAHAASPAGTDPTTNSSLGMAPSAITLAAPNPAGTQSSPVAASKKHILKKKHHHVAKKRVAQKQKKAPPRPEWYADHDRAVELARLGDTKQALAILEPLYYSHGDDLGVTRDYIAILGWDGGHDARVVEVYQTLADPDQPDFVLQQVGRSYRTLHHPNQALAVYQIGLRHSPDDSNFIIGAMRSLAEDGYVERALAVADADIAYHGTRIDVDLAAADIADQYDMYKALHYYERVLQQEPNNTDALRGYIRAAGRMGSPSLAVKTAKEHPGIIPAAELRHLEGDAAAILVRDGTAEPSTPSQRFAVTDQAIVYLNSLIVEWSHQGPEARTDILRARYDRMQAFYNRYMMQDVINEYNNLLQEGVDVPEYALTAVADAYMAVKEPEIARDLYLRVLVVDPKNYDVRRQLFYAYVECDQYDKAFQTVDNLVEDQPVWIRNKSDDRASPNPRRVAAELMAGAARLYAGEVKEGDKRIVPIVTSAPNVASNREALANVYAAHGWPRQALQQYQIGAALPGGPSIANRVGMAEMNLRLQHFYTAEDETQSLLQQYPENMQVQRLARDVEVHNMAELRVSAGYAFEPVTSYNVTGGEGYGIDTLIYSPPINENWRIFAGEYFTHQHEPNTEGSISFSRTTTGAEYRNGDVTAQGGLTYNHFHGDERLGIAGEGTWSISDQWTVAGSAESFSRDTPLRAMNQGVTASFFGGHAVWRQDEEHELRFGGDVMPFSDSNVRTGVDASYAQRVLTWPHIKIDGLADAGESQNTADSNRYYYNPSRDFIALVGARATETLYQRYSTLWQHSFRIEPGLYMEEHYGTSATLRMRYEQRVFFNQTFETGLGVNFARQAYDGQPENDIGLTLDLVDRF